MVNLLEYSSLFLKNANDLDIEFEQQQLEALYKCKLEVYRIVRETRAGTPVTLIEWMIID
jgi:hypothetical protein